MRCPCLRVQGRRCEDCRAAKQARDRRYYWRRRRQAIRQQRAERMAYLREHGYIKH